MDTQATGGNKFTKWAMIIAIVVVLNLFFNYTISLVYKAPAYDDFVKQTQVVEPITNKEDCLKVGGQWTNPDTRYQTPEGEFTTPVKPGTAIGYCDPNFTAMQNFNEATKSYSRTVFIILVILGVISLGLSAVFANVILNLSFAWGGVLSIVIASIRYWTDANNLFKVIILAMALGALIWLSIKKFNK